MRLMTFGGFGVSTSVAEGFLRAASAISRMAVGDPTATPTSATYRVRKFLRRHRGPAVAAAVVLLALVGGVVIGIVEQLAGYFLPAGFQEVTSNVVLLATLIFRPSGLFAEIAGKRV